MLLFVEFDDSLSVEDKSLFSNSSEEGSPVKAEDVGGIDYF